MKVLLTLSILAFLMAIPCFEANAISVDADAYIKGGGSDDNFGTDDKVIIAHTSDDLSNAFKQYLRFDLYSLTGPVVNVALTLTAESEAPQSESFNIYGLNDGAAEAWRERRITWNNAPGNDTSSGMNMIAADTTFLGSFSVPGSVDQGDTVTFANDDFDAFINADTNHFATFVLTPGRSSSNSDFPEFKFAAREHGSFNAPTLNWDAAPASPVPEPSTLILLGLGAAVLFRSKHRLKISASY